MKKLVIITGLLIALTAQMQVQAVWPWSDTKSSGESLYTDASGCARYAGITKPLFFTETFKNAVAYLRFLYKAQNTSLSSVSGLLTLAVTEINPKVKGYSTKDVTRVAKDVLNNLRNYIDNPAAHNVSPYPKGDVPDDLFKAFVTAMEDINYAKIDKIPCVNKTSKLTDSKVTPKSILQDAASGK